MKNSAVLLIIDVQNDFCPGGALPVPEGDAVVAPLNRAIEFFSARKLPIFASRDWHPPITSHFVTYGGIWPPHCVQGTAGAEFHPELHLTENTVIISKGMDPERDDYSALDGVAPDGTPFTDLLRRMGAPHLYVGGLATDYCVKETVLAARTAGLVVTLLTDACRGVEVHQGDSDQALTEAEVAGVRLATVDEIP